MRKPASLLLFSLLLGVLSASSQNNSYDKFFNNSYLTNSSPRNATLINKGWDIIHQADRNLDQLLKNPHNETLYNQTVQLINQGGSTFRQGNPTMSECDQMTAFLKQCMNKAAKLNQLRQAGGSGSGTATTGDGSASSDAGTSDADADGSDAGYQNSSSGNQTSSTTGNQATQPANEVAKSIEQEGKKYEEQYGDQNFKMNTSDENSTVKSSLLKNARDNSLSFDNATVLPDQSGSDNPWTGDETFTQNMESFSGNQDDIPANQGFMADIHDKVNEYLQEYTDPNSLLDKGADKAIEYGIPNENIQGMVKTNKGYIYKTNPEITDGGMQVVAAGMDADGDPSSIDYNPQRIMSENASMLYPDKVKNAVDTYQKYKDYTLKDYYNKAADWASNHKEFIATGVLWVVTPEARAASVVVFGGIALMKKGMNSLLDQQ